MDCDAAINIDVRIIFCYVLYYVLHDTYVIVKLLMVSISLPSLHDTYVIVKLLMVSVSLALL